VSEYPVIVTLENHCQLPMQAQMACMLTEVLGHMIARPADVDITTASPHSLRHKVSHLLGGWTWT
jgi:hypothetical protein